MEMGSVHTTSPTAEGAPDTWLLVRGLAREYEHWFDFPERLGRVLGARVVGLDLPGCGTQWKEAAPLSVAANARHVAGRLRHEYGVPARPWGILGLSFGGMVATALCEFFPTWASHLVLINSSSGLSRPFERLQPEGAAELLRIATLRDAGERERRVYRLVSSLTGEALERCVASAVEAGARHPVKISTVARQLAAAARFRPSEGPRRQTLILSAEGDRLVNPRASVQLAQFFRAPLRVHPTAGHELTLDDPDWVVSRIADWLRAKPTDRS
jgi:pimeloyl-[acyl-carrier protein] methyl ester esterase